MVALFRQGQNRGSLISSLKDGDYSAHLIIFSVLASSAAVITSLSLSFSLHKIASRPPIAFAQTTNGALTVQEVDHLYRSPVVLRKFTGKTLTMLLQWNGRTVDEYGTIKADPGIKVGKNNPIPTLAHEATNAFTTDNRLRSQVTERIAEWSTEKFLRGTATQRLELKKIKIPKKLDKPGHWSIDVIATRYISQGNHIEPIKFNRVLYLRAVPIVEHPLPETATPEEKAFNRIRQYGLEIYRMQNLERR